MKKYLYFFSIITLLVTGCTGLKSSSNQGFKINESTTVWVNPKEPSSVQIAAKDLVSDIEKVTGIRCGISNSTKPTENQIIIQTTDNSIGYEQYQLQTNNGRLLLTGNNEQATIFAIYHFSEHFLGIDPMYFWNDKQPQKINDPAWAAINYTSEKPTFKYRGWFINDEDLLTEWYENDGRRNIDYPYYSQVVSPKIMEKVCETALRMGFNLIIPASFMDIRNPAERALVEVSADRGLFISMHHIEPMGVNAFTYFNYWKAKDGTKPLFSYFSNKEKVQEVWKVYADEWSKFPNVIWQIGLRGIGDRPMWLADPNIPQTNADRGRIISEAMAWQMDYIQQIDRRKDLPVTTTLWAEGSVLNQMGLLEIPEKVTVVFADNSPGWRWQADFFETPRSKNNSYGVYYHHQLWSSGPHLVSIVPPEQTYKVIGQAVEKGDTEYCIMNVGNIREFQYGIKASAAILRNYNKFNPAAFKKEFHSYYFGEHAAATQVVFDKYYDSFELNPEKTSLALMDGQIRGAGQSTLNKIKQQLKDSTAYFASLKAKREQSEESKWGSTALKDMGTGLSSDEQMLATVGSQLDKLRKAEAAADKLLPKLSGFEKQFFRENMVANIQMMVGMSGWLENITSARIAMMNRNYEPVPELLKNAKRAIAATEEAMLIKQTTPKWENWHRGDKKMNIGRMKAQTEEVIDLF